MLKAAQAYLQTQVTTTTQGDLLIMLYDAAIKFLVQAKERIASRDVAQKGILISKALDIIAELNSSLNIQKGGDLARNLNKLYEYCNIALLKGNLNMDLKKLDEVITILGGLRTAYSQINTPEVLAAAQAAQEAAPQPAAPPKAEPTPPVSSAPPAPASQAVPATPQPQGPEQPTYPAGTQMPISPARLKSKIANYGHI